MKKLIFISLIIIPGIVSFTQEKSDSVKKGWNVGFLPIISYNSDLGFNYGVVVNPFDYKDGSVYPNYFQSVFLQLSGYTRGSYDHALRYESYSLIRGIKFTTELKFLGYQTYPFYGYNGNAAVYHYEWEDQEDTDYKTRIFYRAERKIFRFSSDIQDTIGNSRFQWRAGWAVANYRVAPVNIEKINDKLPEEDKLPDTTTLYDEYCDWNLISEDEKDGGTINLFLLGLIYDTRNKLTNPDKGIFTELNISWMPSSLTTGSYSAFSIGFIHKQYITLIKQRLIFAYRLWLNSNISGDQPFYTRQLLTTFRAESGYGGKRTIRGVLMQRIVARDFFLGTFELRSRLFNYRFINQSWYFGANIFMDAGRILKPWSLDLTSVPEELLPVYFGPADKSIHKSAGAGLKIVMNENFVLSAEYAVPFDRQDGISGFYMELNYQF